MSVLAYGVKIDAPSSAPTVAESVSSGSLNGNYQYKVTYVTAWGESLPSSASSTQAITSGKAASLTAIPTSSSANVLSRKLYRTAAGGSSFLLVTTISDNITTTYTDTLADASLGAAAPVFNTADSLQVMNGFTSFSRPAAPSFTNSITAVASGTQPVLISEINVITTCPSGGMVTLMPLSSSLASTRLVIRNNGANPCLLMPSSGNTINSGASLALGVNAFVTLVASSSTNWLQVM